MTAREDAVSPPTIARDDYKIMVLLVDDQPIIGEAIRRALIGQPDIHFHFNPDPFEALSVAEQVKPTVILQDLVMPGVTGLALLTQYRSSPTLKGVPVIVLSTTEEPAVKSEAFSLGANDYLVKLPDSIELVARIRHHSRAYLNQIQRDEAYRALHESQRQLVEKNLELERLTHVDGLTGLSNRRYLDEFMEIQWRRSRRKGEPLSVLMIDVDDFKRYNDHYGHLAGDEVLKKLANIIQDSCRRPTDLAARFGGEEFAVVLSPSSPDETRVMGEKIRAEVERAALPHRESSVATIVTVSVGGASQIPTADSSFPSVIQAADESLYDAKRGGRNRVIVRG
ncbi:diguanylate cyclase domain-containing protein [Dyella choica]|uniref:diguanylate cyclase n=1 Tax=Dyella choica TaxID=1927959 RepID=A0A3S0RLQ4_9GAMM|nr:diguanylate cyclase [Dyella choica]RUL77566.1 diguanylate cyclase [Dyella choica]